MFSEEIDDMIESIFASSRKAEHARIRGDESAMYYHLGGMKVSLDSLFMQRQVAAHHAAKQKALNSSSQE